MNRFAYNLENVIACTTGALYQRDHHTHKLTTLSGEAVDQATADHVAEMGFAYISNVFEGSLAQLAVCEMYQANALNYPLPKCLEDYREFWPSASGYEISKKRGQYWCANLRSKSFARKLVDATINQWYSNGLILQHEI